MTDMPLRLSPLSIVFSVSDSDLRRDLVVGPRGGRREDPEAPPLLANPALSSSPLRGRLASSRGALGRPATRFRGATRPSSFHLPPSRFESNRRFLSQAHVQGTQYISCHWFVGLRWCWLIISILFCEIKEQTYH